MASSGATGLTGAQALTEFLSMAPAPTGVAATDTAALQGLHDAMPASGGVIFLAPGTYALTAAGLTFSKPVRLVGAGHGFMGLTVNADAANAYTAGGSVLQSNAATATGITCTVSGCSFSDLALVNVSGTLPTSGYGLKLTRATNAHVDRVLVAGHFDGIVVENGSYYTLRDNLIFDIVRYGYFIRNLTNADSGDGLLSGGVVTQTPATAFRAATSALRWESGGGLKVIGFKANGTFTNGLDFELAAGATTGNILIDGTSVENFTGYGVKCVAQGAGTLNNLSIVGCEIGTGQGGTPVGVGIGASMRNGVVEGNVFSNLNIGVEDLGGDGWRIGTNSHAVVTFPVQIDSSAPRASTMRVATQIVRDDNAYIVNDNNSGGPNNAQIDVDYRRTVPSTTGVNVTTLWTLGVGNFAGGLLEYTVAGLVQSGGAFSISRRRIVTSDGSGNITLTVPTGWTDISTGAAPPTVTLDVATAGVIKVKIALNGGADIQPAFDHLQYDGQCTTLKQGV